MRSLQAQDARQLGLRPAVLPLPLPLRVRAPRGANHPPTVYVRVSHIISSLDAWISRLFEPERLDETSRALAWAQGPPSAEDGRDKSAT
jgi:hypothetical protein